MDQTEKTRDHTLPSDGRIRVSFMKDVNIVWDWNDLLKDAMREEENMSLAVAGLVISNDIESVFHHGETVLRQLGFEEIVSEYESLLENPIKSISNPARCFGHKRLEKDGKEYHVFCAAFRGTTTLSDVLTDVRSVTDGFLQGGCSCTESLKEYIGRFEGVSRENTVLFLTGHSLGASTANVVGRLCRPFADEHSVFVYTYASPNYETDGEWNDGKTYANFRYYTNLNDLVPRVPASIPPRYFAKIGIGRSFDQNTMENEQKDRFERVYRYFRGVNYEEDKNMIGMKLTEKGDPGYQTLKRHLCHTYMSLLLSVLPDEEIDRHLII